MTDTITQQQAAQIALDAMEDFRTKVHEGRAKSTDSYDKFTLAVKTLRAVLAQQAPQVAQQAEQGWQPIETAPKDGTRVLVFRLLRGEPQIEGAKYRDDIGAWGDGSWSYPSYASPTHWMPLPAAPKVVK